jgi:hypothetical protein
MTAIVVQILDVRPERLGNSQAVQGEQRDEGVVAGRAESGLDEQSAELVAVQPEGP